MSINEQLNNNWNSRFNELCYEVFFKSETGKALLTHLESKYFRSPVANPSQSESWAFFNEGRNELIRSFSMGIIQHINQGALKAKPKSPINKKAMQTKPLKG